MKTVYDKIEEVLKQAGRALAPHEFDAVIFHLRCDVEGIAPTSAVVTMAGRHFIGCSESALGRRLREMRQQGRVTSSTREGKTFKEFALAVREPVAV